MSPEERQAVARAGVAACFVALGAFVLAYRVLVLGHLEQTAALFVGLPTLLGVLTAILARPRTAIGMALAVVTLALLASAVVLGEGFVCALFAAPLFYGVAIAAAVVVNYVRGSRGGPRAFASALLPFLVASSEGVFLSLPREATVTATRVVAADRATVLQALSRPPDLSVPLPPLLGIGFPIPVEVEGSGLHPGDARAVRFAGGEGAPGWMRLQVVEATPSRVVFERVEDTSHLDHWLSWDRSEVRLAPTDGGVEVTWTVRYTRKLDPAWTFDPLQRVVVHRAADWLIQSTATPR